VDIVTLADELARFKEIESVAGCRLLLSLIEGLPGAARSSKSTSAS
jgi:hypothetical protein